MIESKFKILVENRKCMGCFTCSLHCSMAKQQIFNPMNAYIRVSNQFEQPNIISFTEDCDRCGICARHCAYGALTVAKE